MSEKQKTIGIIGLGLIGGSMAIDLKRRGFASTVLNGTERAGGLVGNVVGSGTLTLATSYADSYIYGKQTGGLAAQDAYGNADFQLRELFMHGIHGIQQLLKFGRALFVSVAAGHNAEGVHPVGSRGRRRFQNCFLGKQRIGFDSGMM